MKITCIIVDDEPTARSGLAADLEEIDFIEVKASAANAFEALEKIKECTPDLVFLDIEMPGLSGTDFLKLLRPLPMVIITTAYPQFALEGFELGVTDYLVKPVSQLRLRAACEKAQEQFMLRRQAPIRESKDDYCYLKCDGVFEKVPYDAILYVEAANNYVLVHTRDRRFMTYSSLKNIAIQLPGKKFVRIHKSYIVSRDHLTQITSDEVFIGQIRIPLSRNFKTSFHEQVVVPKWRLK